MNHRGVFGFRLFAAALIAAGCAGLLVADAIGYSLVYDCKAENSQFVAEHHHDWSEATRKARWKMISTDKNVLSSENTYSSLLLTSRGDGREIFQVPTPALSYLWISPDSRFIVGVSNIKLWNPLQLVVLNAQGAVLLAKPVDESSFPGVSGSVTNWVYWYHEPSPTISITPVGDHFVLKVEGNAGVDRVFEF